MSRKVRELRYELAARAKACYLRLLVEGWEAISAGLGIQRYFLPPLIHLDWELLRWDKKGDPRLARIPGDITALVHVGAALARLLAGGKIRENPKFLAGDDDLGTYYLVCKIAIKKAAGDPIEEDEVRNAARSLILSSAKRIRLVRDRGLDDPSRSRVLDEILSRVNGLAEKRDWDRLGSEVEETAALVKRHLGRAGGVSVELENPVYDLASSLASLIKSRLYRMASVMLQYSTTSNAGPLVNAILEEATKHPFDSLTRFALVNMAEAIKSGREDRLVYLARSVYSVLAGVNDWSVRCISSLVDYLVI